MDLNEIKQDLDAAEDGVFFDFSEDASVKIAQWGNKEHKKFLRDLNLKHGRKIEAGAISEEAAGLLLSGQWPYIIKGWKGFTDDGKPLKFSPQTVVELAKNPQYRKFFDRVEVIAKGEENYRVISVKEMGEASPTS